MEPVVKQLRELTKKFQALSSTVRFAILGVVALAVVVAVLIRVGMTSGTYEYAFTNLSPEDSAEAASQLKIAKVPFRLEAGGTALAVPAAQVYDARLLLAAAGLPRGGGVGFEIFDRGDLGVSEFTQRVNLRRATEGELARTIGRLASVRSARVHITMPEKGLYRDDDRKATAAVVLNLQQGRTLSDREVQGIRHLVSSAVAGLSPEAVAVVDGRGTVLAGDSSPATKAATEQREMERGLEQRVVDLLEPAVGPGAVVAKVAASFDNADVETNTDAYDPDATAVRSEHKTTEQIVQDSTQNAGVAGAAANQPLAGPPGGGGPAVKGTTSREDETKNYEVTRTTTHTVSRGPRLKRLSIAVLVDAPAGKARGTAELKRLADLAKSAVGFDAKRGDQLEISSTVFTKGAEEKGTAETWWASPRTIRLAEVAGVFLLLSVIAFALLRRRRPAVQAYPVSLIQPGQKVAELEAAMEKAQSLPKAAAAEAPALPPPDPEAAGALQGVDPNVQVRDRARELVMADPARAAHLVRAWIQSDEEQGAPRRA